MQKTLELISVVAFLSGVECPCYQQNVENGVVNRVQVGNGCSYQYTVTCNSGYEAFGPVTYECGSTGMTPRFATRCIPEGSCKWNNKCISIIIIIIMR